MDVEELRTTDAHRLDAFVDAAFAFAVTLLLISTGDPIPTLEGLYQALGRIPASLASFVLVIVFWLAHRNYGRITPRRNQTASVISLALVFSVLAYVFPLRMLIDSGFHWVSGHRLPGQVLIRSLDDVRVLFVVFGLGFAIQAAIVATLFGHAAAKANDLGVDASGRREARGRSTVWMIIASAGVLSAILAALTPLPLVPIVPGLAYALIPVAIHVWLRRRRAPAEDAQ